MQMRLSVKIGSKTLMFRQKFVELNPNPYSGKEGIEEAERIPATEKAKPAPVQENKSDV
jgi:hypothetical protein